MLKTITLQATIKTLVQFQTSLNDSQSTSCQILAMPLSLYLPCGAKRLFFLIAIEKCITQVICFIHI